MKDGTNADMLRGAVSKLLPVEDFRMGKPTIRNGMVSLPEYIGYGRQTQGTETYMPGGRESKCDFLSSGERNGI